MSAAHNARTLMYVSVEWKVKPAAPSPRNTSTTSAVPDAVVASGILAARAKSRPP
jgi:hypothetical protein